MHHLTKYPFTEMEIDQKLTLPFEDRGSAVKARVAAHSYGQWSNKRFRTRIIDGLILHIRRVV